jgi:hypothetical protein
MANTEGRNAQAHPARARRESHAHRNPRAHRTPDCNSRCVGLDPILSDVARALHTVEEDHLHAYVPTERGTLMGGWVHLRYGGNGWDTLTNHCPRLREALAPALALIEELRAKRYAARALRAA